MADNVRDITMNVTANTRQAEESLARLKGATEQAGQAMEKKKESTVNAGGAVISFGESILNVDGIGEVDGYEGYNQAIDQVS